jgi:hypothetical protein
LTKDADLDWFRRDMGLTVQLYNRSQAQHSPWDDHHKVNGSMRGLEGIGVKGESTIEKQRLRKLHAMKVLEAQNHAREEMQRDGERKKSMSKAEQTIAEASRNNSKTAVQRALELAQSDAKHTQQHEQDETHSSIIDGVVHEVQHVLNSAWSALQWMNPITGGPINSFFPSGSATH